MTRPLRLLGGLLIVGVLAVVPLILFPSLPDPTCAALLVRSESDVPILLPANCVRSRGVTAYNMDMVKYLEKERNGRGLVFKEWITCTEVPAGGFAFMNDPHWLPSYVPGTYQFRRTVIIVPYAQPTPQGPPVIAEVCLMPWRKYVSQLAGQCDDKYKVWR
jgi:hypothetical protein